MSKLLTENYSFFFQILANMTVRRLVHITFILLNLFSTRIFQKIRKL